MLFVGERVPVCERLEWEGGAAEPALDGGGRTELDTVLRGGSPVGARIGGGMFARSYDAKVST